MNITYFCLFRAVRVPKICLFRAVWYTICMLERIYKLDELVRKDKILVLYGPRQVGKTTLVEAYLDTLSDVVRVRYVTGNDSLVAQTLSHASLRDVEEFVAGYDMLVIDEAQKIPNIGNALKLIIDKIKTVKVIVTGSASFELAGQIGEPLTGRKRTITLYPLSQLELLKTYNKSELRAQLDEFLIYGSYPEVVTSGINKEEKRKVLKELVSSYLLKDLLELEDIKSSKVLWDLLRLIALQIGSEVSHSELADKLGVNKKTVARYLDLLEKTFVLHNVRGYSKNLRKEITRKGKYYFYDVGVRNAIINNFNSFDMRDDAGALFENFLIMERLKLREYTNIYANEYFWRTWDQKEIDLVEERGGKLFGYEIKWNNKKQPKAPKDWIETYSNASYEVINKENYLEFIS